YKKSSFWRISDLHCACGQQRSCSLAGLEERCRQMANHRAVSPHSLKARTVVAGVLTSGALLVGAPAGMALATPHQGDTMNNQSVSQKPSPKEIGAAINKVIAGLPTEKKVKLATAFGSLPTETQQKIVKVATKLGGRPEGSQSWPANKVGR
ncbi:MAG: hypothetical protein ACXVGO_06740, partial [Mycobacterium sp.]